MGVTPGSFQSQLSVERNLGRRASLFQIYCSVSFLVIDNSRWL